MHVGLNLLYLLPGVVGGTETYARALIDELAARSSEGSGDRFTAFVNRESRGLLDDVAGLDTVVCEVEAVSRPRRYLFEQTRLPGLLRSHGVDVVHSLGYVGPWYPKVPHVVTIHDLIHVGFADHMPTSRRLTLQVAVRGVAKRADRIITVSESSRRQIVADMPAVASKVVVVHEAARPGLRPAADAAEVAADRAVLGSYGVADRYVVAFSSKSPSKNVPALVEAMATLADLPWQLVLVGHVPDSGEVAAAIARSGVADRIVTTGYVPDDHVAPLLRNAAVFAFPSLYEGFGLPILDAQAVGVPVACSDVASLPEVAGDGAALFDPTDPASMAAALRRLLSDAAVGRDLVEQGRANVSQYSWRRAAEETTAVYRAVDENRGSS